MSWIAIIALAVGTYALRFAGPVLRDVHQPTLLLVGGRDPLVLELNREAARELGGEARLVVVSGATHLFEESRALARVAGLARDWFLRHLRADPAGGRADPQG